jgi:hypothetical protein
MNGIFYVVTASCTWQDVSRQYGSKSTVHRFHLYLCEHGTYQEIFNELSNKGYDLKKLTFLIVLLIQRTFLPKKRGNVGYDGYKKVKGIKLSVLVDLQELPLYCCCFCILKMTQRFYILTLRNFKIRRPRGRHVNRPSKVTADAIKVFIAKLKSNCFEKKAMS